MRTKPVRYLLLTVLFVTSCVTYEPAASGLVSDGAPLVRSVAVPRHPRPDDGLGVERTPQADRVERPGRSFVGVRRSEDRRLGGAGPRAGTSRGSASWCAPTPRYCHGWQPPALFAAVSSFRYGDDRYTVTVQGPAGTVTVTVVSYGVLPKGRVIDLSPAAFQRACGDLSMGVCRVVVKGLR